jgi:hypothetical protein
MKKVRRNILEMSLVLLCGAGHDGWRLRISRVDFGKLILLDDLIVILPKDSQPRIRISETILAQFGDFSYSSRTLLDTICVRGLLGDLSLRIEQLQFGT